MHDPRRLLYVAMFLAIESVLVTRPIGLALDDFDYLAYFETADWFRFSELPAYSLIVEEPLWELMIHVLSLYLDPESAFRFVIFCSVATYAWAFRKAHSSALMFVLIAFLVCPSMFTQIYFNQVRQGLAISLFLALLSLGGWGYVVGVIASGLVHTSQIALLPLSPGSRKLFLISLGATVIGIAALTMAGFQLSPSDVDLGRRGEVYSFDSSLNYFFLAVTAPLYFGILGLVWHEHVRLQRAPEPILYQSLIFCVLAYVISFGFEGGGRVFYLLDALVVWTVSRFWRGRVPFYAWVWICAQFALGVYSSYKENFAAETQWGRMEAILTSW